MRLLFLRGEAVRKKEIAFDSIEKENDMWTELAYAMTGPTDMTKVLYWGGYRKVYYSDNFCVQWVDSLKSYHASFKPDVIFARGGFPEYDYILKEFPMAYKIYYGAGKRWLPKSKYDLVLVDSVEQARKARTIGHNARVFIKPASHIFKPVDVPKWYDIGFSAVVPTDERKRVKWVYKKIPKNLSMLQMGHQPPFKVPDNIKVKYIQRHKMPRAISKCKVIICPYTKDDSCPRIIPEALACNVPVVVIDTVRIWQWKYLYPLGKVPKVKFWDEVERIVRKHNYQPRKYYDTFLTMDMAAKYIMQLITG